MIGRSTDDSYDSPPPSNSQSTASPGILVPVKQPSQSKTRLAGCLNGTARRDLVLVMVDHMAKTLSDLSLDCRVLFVTESESVTRTVRKQGVECTNEPPDADGLAAVVDRVIETTLSDCRGTLVLPVDLPFLSSETVERLLHEGRRSTVILVPDRDGGGTNAIWRRSPAVLACGWHGTRSFETHRRRALANDVDVRVMRPPDVTFDLDTPRDWNHLRKRTDRLSVPLRDFVRAHANHGT